MATIGLKAYTATTTVLSTELNALANANLSAVGATVLDNSTNLDLYADFELNVTFGSAPTVGTKVDLYMSSELDGTNYEVMPATGTTAPDSSKKVGSFVVETTATAQRIHLWRVPLLPTKMKLQAMNNAGVAFPASGSTVIAHTYSMQSV